MAADTYSSILGLLLQGTGNNNNAWGGNLNSAVISQVEKSIGGRVALSVTGAGDIDYSASPPPAAALQRPEMILDISGTLTNDQTFIFPNLPKLFIVRNACTGNFALKFKTTSGTAVTIPQGGWGLVWCDGSNGFYLGLSTALRDVQWQGPDGTISLPGISFSAQTSLGLRRVSSGVMALTVGGVDIATISATGVDVGTGLSLTVGGVSVVPPGTEVNYAGINAPTGWYFEYGQTVTRSGDPNLLAAITTGFTADTHGTTILTNVSKDLRNLGLEGSTLEGTGMFTGAKIVSVDSATQITMDHAATNTAAGGAVTAFPYGNGDGSTTFTLPDARGTVAAGRDNMGGTAAGKLTTAGSGVNGLQLNTIGGAQNITMARSDLPNTNVTVSISDPGHAHTQNSLSLYGKSSGTGFYGTSNAGGSQIWLDSAVTTNSATTGITASFQLNGNVTQTAMLNVQPTRIRNVLIKR